MKRNLRIGFPKNKDDNYICHSVPFKKDCTNRKNYDVIINHHVWSPVIDEVLPNATKITILREPLSQLVSAFQYFPPSLFTQNKINLKSFEDFINSTSATEASKVEIRENTHNPMAFDLGLSPMYRDKTEEELADWLVGYYDLIMITEYFDESLILLKNLLSLEFSDIAYLKWNKNTNFEKIFHASDVSETAKEQFYAMEKVDNALYKQANKTFWEKVQAFGSENVKREKEAFQKYCEQMDTDESFMNLSVPEFIKFMRSYQRKSLK